MAEQKPKHCSVVGNETVCVRHLHVNRRGINARIVAATVSIRRLWGSHYLALSTHAFSLTNILTEYNFHVCVISGFRLYVTGICALLGHYAASSGNSLQTFRDNPPVRPRGQGHRTLENDTDRSHQGSRSLYS